MSRDSLTCVRSSALEDWISTCTLTQHMGGMVARCSSTKMDATWSLKNFVLDFRKMDLRSTVSGLPSIRGVVTVHVQKLTLSRSIPIRWAMCLTLQVVLFSAIAVSSA